MPKAKEIQIILFSSHHYVLSRQFKPNKINQAQFIYEISPLIYVFFPIPIMGKIPLQIPVSFIPISLIAANGKIFQ